MTDDETYAIRRRIADESAAQLAEAVAACGPEAAAYGCWVVTDTLGEHPPRRVWCCDRHDGSGWQPDHGSTGERITDPARAVFVKGVAHYPFRYTIGFKSIAEYRPRTPEQLQLAAKARATKRGATENARLAEAAAATAADPQLSLALEAST